MEEEKKIIVSFNFIVRGVFKLLSHKKIKKMKTKPDILKPICSNGRSAASGR